MVYGKKKIVYGDCMKFYFYLFGILKMPFNSMYQTRRKYDFFIKRGVPKVSLEDGYMLGVKKKCLLVSDHDSSHLITIPLL